MKKLNLPATALALGLATAPLAEAQGGPILDAAHAQYPEQPERVITTVVERVNAIVGPKATKEEIAAGYAELEVARNFYEFPKPAEELGTFLKTIEELQVQLKNQAVPNKTEVLDEAMFVMEAMVAFGDEFKRYMEEAQDTPENKQVRFKKLAAIRAFAEYMEENMVVLVAYAKVKNEDPTYFLNFLEKLKEMYTNLVVQEIGREVNKFNEDVMRLLR